MAQRRIGARLLPALLVAFALVTAGPAALLAAAPKDRSTHPGRSAKGGPQSTDVATSSRSGSGSDRGLGSTQSKTTGKDKGTSAPGASNGKATGQDKQADRGPVGNGHGKAKGHDKRPTPAPVDRPGTVNPGPGGRDNPGPNKGPDQGSDPTGREGGRKALRTSETGPTGATGRSESGSGSSGSTGTPAPVRTHVSTGAPKHVTRASTPFSQDARPSLATQLFAAGVEGQEATKRFAFPLLLTVIVVLFLMLQGRFDRKDEKLSLAPVDYSEGLLTFE